MQYQRYACWIFIIIINVFFFTVDALVMTFGVLFGICLLLVVLMALAIPIAIVLKNKLHHNGTGGLQ